MTQAYSRHSNTTTCDGDTWGLWIGATNFVYTPAYYGDMAVPYSFNCSNGESGRYAMGVRGIEKTRVAYSVLT